MQKSCQEDIMAVREEFDDISHSLDERRIRLWCAAKAKAHDRIHKRGGITVVWKATGVSRPRIYGGLKEIEVKHQGESALPNDRVRKAGGGRKKITSGFPDILEALEKLVEPLCRGDPESPLRWTCKSTYNLRDELRSGGYPVSQPKVGHLLRQLGYSLQSNRKTEEGNSHQDRNAQFEYINDRVSLFQEQGCPALSVDTKKKENIGNYKNNGKEYRPKGNPETVKGHDFPDKKLGKAAPYGVYDIAQNNGFVNVGISSDTAEFAVSSIRSWWEEMGRAQYGNTSKILVTADCGGSNGHRTKLWKVKLQELSDELGAEMHVCHFPPGTSKWNKIEHRMFCHISKNWRGKPLTSRETIVNLIGSTKTKKGLVIKAKLDEREYEKGIQVSEQEMNALNIKPDEFHGEWNYVIIPRNPENL